MNYVVPFMLVNGDQEAMEFTRTPGSYDSTLTGDDVYVEGDLVELSSGKVIRSQETTPATLEAKELFLAGQDHKQDFALDYFLDNGVPLNLIPARNEFVMTYQHSAADGSNYTFLAADLQAVQAHQRREIVWNDTEKCYTVRNGTTNPKVTLLRVFKGEVGDDNVQVVVRLDTLAGA